MNAATNTKDIEALGRGKAQKAVLVRLHALPIAGAVQLTELARASEFRGVHFAQIMSAVDALVKRGIVLRETEPNDGDYLRLASRNLADLRGGR